MNLLDSLDRAALRAADLTGHCLSTHPRKVSAAVVVVLAGFGATAFGIAPHTPDPSDLPKRVVIETVDADPIQAQLDVLATHDLQLYRTDVTRSTDTADTLLRRLNVSDADAARFLRTDPLARTLLSGRGGKLVRVQTDAHGDLVSLVARYAPEDPAKADTEFSRLTIQRGHDGLTATVTAASLTRQLRIGSGTIRTSLFAATDDANIPDKIANQLIEVFSSDIDFHRRLHRGDTFSVVYETLTADGEPITWGSSAAGRIMAADFVNDGRRYSAVWYANGQEGGAYYDLDGHSKKHEFLASPMAFSRITSGFSMRLHPILKTWTQHKGVDYGAPVGTPIRTIGDGVVTFSGRQTGYGNVVEINHGDKLSTLYAHMSRIDVQAGQKVAQGQTIGAVGATGWATGPHLHFEFKVDGVQRDPLVMAKANVTVPLTASERAAFDRVAQDMRSQLAVADTLAHPGGGGYAE